MPKQTPSHGRRDLFEDRRHNVQKPRPMHARLPLDDVVTELSVKNERQKEQITHLHACRKHDKEELDKAKLKAAVDDKEIRKLRKQLAEQTSAADAHAETQDALISFGTGAVRDQRVRAETAEAKAARLQAVVTELESSVSSLQEQITHYESAITDCADDYTRSCLEAQAQGSVRMVQGYQKDIAKQKDVIGTLRCTVAQRDKGLRELELKDAERSRELEETKRKLAASKRRADAIQDIADEQAALIERLNAENTKLISQSPVP
ncbi:hypothetical protein Slin14017_G108870 [Septoria linicola]|nr:hypothetical protein Slin14017_G108870 [Septoria linicola]